MNHWKATITMSVTNSILKRSRAGRWGEDGAGGGWRELPFACERREWSRGASIHRGATGMIWRGVNPPAAERAAVRDAGWPYQRVKVVVRDNSEARDVRIGSQAHKARIRPLWSAAKL
jgi:hypothetical protein